MDEHGQGTSAKELTILPGAVVLGASLTVPEPARGIVVFIHGSGSSRFSPRNRFVAGDFNQHGLATLLLDLLTPLEQKVDDVTGELRFDIDLLSGRATQCVDWVRGQKSLQRLAIGLFGVSTGAAAALNVAAARPTLVAAVVSRGGRPDLAAASLPGVLAPTLLIVGGKDQTVLAMNRDAAALLKVSHKI